MGLVTDMDGAVVIGAEGRRKIDYKPSPTCKRFHWDSKSLYRFLMGPFGSGKSTACVMEILNRAHLQAPGADGVRRVRCVALRNTYPELKSTTIKTWTDWVPEEECPINWAAPISAKMKKRLPDGSLLDFEMLFISMDRTADVAKALGLEATMFWVNEAREIPFSIISVLDRVGRYPSMKDGGPTWSGIIGDTNPPDTDHWFYRLAEQKCPEGWAFYKQPGALIRKKDGSYVPNPEAENVAHLTDGYGYYHKMVPGKPEEHINVYVLGQYGKVFTGRGVYEGVYDDVRHVSRDDQGNPMPLGVYRGLPLLVGFDFGNTPACVIAQETRTGVLNVLREYQCEYGGIYQFVTDTVRPALLREFAGMSLIAVGDPAGTAGSQANTEVNCFNELARLGIQAAPASTNDFTMRRESVMFYLSRMSNNRPAFQLDPSCQMLRRGFQGGYEFSRVQVIGDERYRDIPSKNQYSHLHDALQYVCLRANQPVASRPASRKALPDARPRGMGGWT